MYAVMYSRRGSGNHDKMVLYRIHYIYKLLVKPFNFGTKHFIQKVRGKFAVV